MGFTLIWQIADALWTALVVLLGILTAGHALLHKRDPKGAFGWITVCLFFPIVGPCLYFVFGINRVQRRANRLIRRTPQPTTSDLRVPADARVSSDPLYTPVAIDVPQSRISGRISPYPICSGNRITLLHNGEEAYPAMLREIEKAQRSVYLTTYIFDVDETGRRFIQALEAAHRRGVRVRVLIDGLGEMNWGPVASRQLKKRGVPVARHIPPSLFPPTLSINLRNHRKILLIDSEQVFTGGMNISDRHLVQSELQARRKSSDIHFRFVGPVARQIEEVFNEDWLFTTGERLPSPPPLAETGVASFCRIIPDGPDEEMGILYSILAGVLSSAQKTVRIMTPYFIPPRGILAALQAAALRGVGVDIVLPEKNDIPFVHWATRNLLWELLSHDVRIYYQPPPFAHTKLVLVDGHYVQIGSANIDNRSLRLNFEMNVDIYDSAMAGSLTDYFLGIKSRCRTVTLEEVDSRPLAERLRDSCAWLFSSYL